MVYVALVLFTLVLAALGAWVARRPVRSRAALPCSSDRLGIRELREVPYGPPGRF